MVAPRMGLRSASTAGQGLAYRPLSPGRQAAAGGLQGLGALLMAIASGQPQNAAAAFQVGLQGANEADWRRQEQARRDEEFAYRQQERADATAERERQRQERDAAKAKFGEFSALFSDDDPTNDPTGLQDLLPYLDPEQGYGVVADMFAQPESTDDIREYNLYTEQGGTQDFTTWLRDNKKAGAGNSSTTIYNKDYGNIPPGFRLIETPQGVQMEAVPGSPAATDAAAAVEVEQQQTANQQQSADIVTQDISRAVEKIEQSPNWTAGFFGNALSGVGGTEANNVRKLIDTVEANTAFDRLQAMRNASKTGGALGSITERELQLLAATRGSLEQSQDAKQLAYNLKRLNNVILDIVHGPGKGPKRYDLGEVVDELPPGNWQ